VKKGYYAVIPAEIRYDNKLSPNEKLLYGELTALSNKEGYCYASNKYFAQLYKVHKNTVSRWISNIEKQEYIFIQQLDGYKRKIYIETLNKSIREDTYKDDGGINKKVYTPTQNAEDYITNNTINNTTMNIAQEIFK